MGEPDVELPGDQGEGPIPGQDVLVSLSPAWRQLPSEGVYDVTQP